MRLIPIPSQSSLRRATGRALAALALVAAYAASAHPYASGITNSGGTIKFILNENADSVQVAFDNRSVTNDLTVLGQTNRGVNSFALGVHTNYAIIVSKVGTGTPAQLSVDSNPLVNFLTPRGVIVNRNAKTGNFGRTYVVNSTPGTSGGRTVGRGLYILNADQSDALGRGNTASTAGVVFTSANGNSPYTPGIGPDDMVYLNDFASPTATTWMFDPDITVSNLVLAGIGATANTAVHTDSVNHPLVRGSLAAGNLQLWNLDGSYPPFNSLLRWDIGAGPLPWNTAPNAVLGTAGISSVADLSDDVDMGPDGKFYILINRSAGTDVDSIQVFDTDGVTKLWGSLATGGSPDPLRQARELQVSLDGKYLGIVHDDNHISILPLVGGIPDLSNLSVINQTPATTIGRGFSFDAANNVYTTSSGETLLRVWSLGFTTTAVTSNDATGTNGTFQLLTPPTTVSVAATTPIATEAGLVPGVFTVTRISTDTSGPLTVNFVLSGTATNGIHYNTTATNFVVIAPSQTSTNITITPIEDHVSDPTLTVVLSLKGGGSYSAVAPSKDTVFIADDGPQVLIISGTSSNSMYEAITNDYVAFTVNRWGDTNAASYTMSNFVYGGTAVANVDFVPFSGTLTFDPGTVSQNINISPLHNPAYTGNKTLTVAVGAGIGYTANPASASATIIDAETAPENRLFADDLIGAGSAANWNLFFVANNGISDYECVFGFNLADDGVSSAPNGSATALKVTVNKDEGSANGAAALNLYPIGKSFAGNFALRFNMNLVQNDTAGTTEFAAFGINQSGTKTNWVIETGDFAQIVPIDCDGLWYSVVSDASGSAPADYTLFTSNGPTAGPAILRSVFASTLQNIFKQPPYSSGGGAGSPGNLHGVGTSVWSDVEIKNFGNVVTLSINKTPIIKYTNTTSYASGDIMLGYIDPYASIGSVGGAAYYSNVRVVALPSPLITSTVKSGSNLNLTFTDDSNDPVASFRLLGSSLVTGTYTNMSATITQTGIGTYSTSTPIVAGSATKFFRIQHLP